MTSLIEIYRRFPSKEAAVTHLEKVRWPKGSTAAPIALRGTVCPPGQGVVGN